MNPLPPPTHASTFTPSVWRRIFCSLFLIGAAAAAIGAVASPRATGGSTPNTSAGDGTRVAQIANSGRRHFAPAQKIASWVIEHTANGQQAEFFVVLADQADISGAASLPTKAEKGRYVYNTLLNKAQTTQEPILQWLRDRGIQHQSFYIVNLILVKANREVAEALAARQDVAHV